MGPGGGVARFYAPIVFGVRLPLSLDQLNVIGWPTGQSNAPDPTAKQSSQINPIVNARPKAGLTAPFGDTIQHWQGHIVRIEGAFSESTGLLHAVVGIGHHLEGDAAGVHRLEHGAQQFVVVLLSLIHI